MGYKKQFAHEVHDLGGHSTHKLRLNQIDNEPVLQQKHRLSQTEWDFVEEKVTELHKHGLVEPATGHYAAATVLPAKKDADGQYTDRRMCRDYRALNAKTKLDPYCMPTPEEIFDEIE